MRKLVSLCCSLLFSGVLLAQHSINGKITDEEGSALVGASIAIQNTYVGVSANSVGEYSINNLNNGNYTLEVSFIGYAPKILEVVIDNNDVQQNFELERSANSLSELVVEATRVPKSAPVAYENVSGKQIAQNNSGVDIPVMLDQATSVVSTSDAGAGVGYTGMRIRGSDGTRINVSINGIPLNDPESHGVWWVNMPDLATSTSDIQIQRGVGTSTNGAGAFGASINKIGRAHV